MFQYRKFSDENNEQGVADEEDYFTIEYFEEYPK